MTWNTDVTWADRVAKATLLIRILVGWVFLSEGIQKFLFPDSLGVGRFVKIGIPWPQVMAPFVGVVEIVCGTARGPHRCEHAVWFDLSVAGWWRITCTRCLACFQKA